MEIILKEKICVNTEKQKIIITTLLLISYYINYQLENVTDSFVKITQTAIYPFAYEVI